MSNLKMADVVNLKVTFEKGGNPKYKTKYDPDGNTTFMVGRRVDWQKDHEAEGNFEVAKPIKGQSPDSWSWEVVPYDRAKYVETFSYLVKADDQEGWLELSWSANEALKNTVGVNQYDKAQLPATVKVRRPDKAYEFEKLSEGEQPATVEDIADIATPEPIDGIKPEDLPF